MTANENTRLIESCSIGFVPILIPCVYNSFGDCDGAIEAGYNKLYGADVYQQWADLIRDYQLGMQWLTRPADQKKTAIYQTAYPPFFDSWTTDCNYVARSNLMTTADTFQVRI